VVRLNRSPKPAGPDCKVGVRGRGEKPQKGRRLAGPDAARRTGRKRRRRSDRGEHSEAHAVVRSSRERAGRSGSAREEGSGAARSRMRLCEDRSHAGTGEGLKGTNVRRAAAASGLSARAVRTLRGEQSSGVERRFVRLSGWRSTRTAREQARRREAYGSAGRNEALKTEPHERYRDETGPDGVAGWKPSRACETLWTEGGGPGRARDDRIRCSSCAVGEGSPGGRHPVRAIASESISG
jgi:hypothetical protein